MNESVLSKLLESISLESPDQLEEAVNFAWQSGMNQEYVQVLNEALYLTALKKYDYLDYDEDFALARKCTWALADIGTSEAKLKLEELQKCDNQLISNFALKRLQGWDSEQHRKGT